MSDAERTRWNRRYRERTPARPPSPYLVEHADILPRCGRALDIAGGDGRNALWLARRGLEVTLVDISENGLARALANANAAGVRLHTIAADVDRDPLPPGPWHVILVVDFLLPPRVLANAIDRLDAGGWFVWVHPTVRNLERHRHPSARFLLGDGESVRLIADLGKSDLAIIEYREGWQENGRHESRMLVRRSGAP